MKTVSLKYDCKCGANTTVLTFKKPSPYYGSTLFHTCSSCKSEFVIKVLKVKGDTKIFVKNAFVSPQLAAATSRQSDL